MSTKAKTNKRADWDDRWPCAPAAAAPLSPEVRDCLSDELLLSEGQVVVAFGESSLVVGWSPHHGG
jgi:hypothetical protein